MKNLLVLIFSIVGLASCDSTYQYDVLVKNESGSPIQVNYKTVADVRGEIEETVTVKDGELKRIISTVELKPYGKSNGMSAAHCSHVAEYVRAYKEEKQSENKWCDKEVKFQKVDIGQGEFILTYRAEDF